MKKTEVREASSSAFTRVIFYACTLLFFPFPRPPLPVFFNPLPALLALVSSPPRQYVRVCVEVLVKRGDCHH